MVSATSMIDSTRIERFVDGRMCVSYGVLVSVAERTETQISKRQAQELRVEMQQLKAKNHGLMTQMDALAADHERLAALLATVEKVGDTLAVCCCCCCSLCDAPIERRSPVSPVWIERKGMDGHFTI